MTFSVAPEQVQASLHGVQLSESSDDSPVHDFPLLIQSAMYRLSSRKYAAMAACLLELDMRERALMVELLRNVSASDPSRSARVANATLALVLGVSERSVSRLKAQLVDKGWIRRHQVKSRRRGMQVSDVWLTEAALDALGMQRCQARRAMPAQRAPRVAHACLLSQSFSKRTRHEAPELPEAPDVTAPRTETEPLATAGSSALMQEPPKDVDAREGDVPSDVATLIDRGVSAAGVRLLMGLATRAGTRLAHVLQCAAPLIAGARNAFAYVRRLIESGRDWSSMFAKGVSAAEDHAIAEHKQVDQESVVRALGSAIHTHAKGLFAWRVIAGVIHRSSAQDAARGGIGNWLPIGDFDALAKAWREGRVYPVQQGTYPFDGSSAPASVAVDFVRRTFP